MNRIIVFAVIVFVGLPIGFFVRDALQPAPDRAASAIELFRTYCLPFAQQKSPSPTVGLVEVSTAGSGTGWADPNSHILLEMSASSCTVSDTLAIMTVGERDEFESKARVLITESFPMLSGEDIPDSDQWDLFLGWFQYDRQDPRRWGAILTRRAESGAEASTQLRLAVVPN